MAMKSDVLASQPQVGRNYTSTGKKKRKSRQLAMDPETNIANGLQGGVCPTVQCESSNRTELML